jgi:hypothetical protein
MTRHHYADGSSVAKKNRMNTEVMQEYYNWEQNPSEMLI